MAQGKKQVSVSSQTIREGVTAAIALAIAAISLWMLADTYLSGKSQIFQKDAFERQKDILLLALGFLGTVTGYYLGRVPAEKQADAARGQAKAAAKNEERIKREVLVGLAAMKQQGEKVGGGTASGLDREIERLRATLIGSE